MTHLIRYRMTSLWSSMALIFLVIGLVGFSTLGHTASGNSNAYLQPPTPSTLTQSNAHISHKVGFDLVKKTWLIHIAKDENLETLIQLAMQREQQHANHFVFYHGQAGYMRILHDFLAEIYPHVMNRKAVQDFIFLRFWGNANDNLKKELIAHHGITWEYDYEPDMIKLLLSVNFSIFGNTSRDGECSFYYFLNSKSINFSTGTIKKL